MTHMTSTCSRTTGQRLSQTKLPNRGSEEKHLGKCDSRLVVLRALPEKDTAYGAIASQDNPG